MKKFVALLTALLLLSGLAGAETVTVSVWQDESAAQVEMTLYQSGLGYTIAYDPAHFTLEPGVSDVITLPEYEYAYLSVQSVTDMTAQELAEGLALQSGQDECQPSISALGGTFADAVEVPSVIYITPVNGVDYVCCFLLVERASDVLQVECYYPLEMDTAVAAELVATLESFTLTDGTVVSTPAQTGLKMVQCPVCGNWFTEGNEFRNHICVAQTYPSESNMVQCETCGKWFEAGNEFRNHICVAETYPSESNMVQCEICGKWFQEGNEFRNHICVTETYPSESNMVQCEICGKWFQEGNEFRNHICVTETYPSQDNRVDTYPCDDIMVETYPSEDNVADPVPQG